MIGMRSASAAGGFLAGAMLGSVLGVFDTLSLLRSSTVAGAPWRAFIVFAVAIAVYAVSFAVAGALFGDREWPDAPSGVDGRTSMLLLTRKEALPPQTERFLTAHDFRLFTNTEGWVVGGQGAVSAAVQADLEIIPWRGRHY